MFLALSLTEATLPSQYGPGALVPDSELQPKDGPVAEGAQITLWADEQPCECPVAFSPSQPSACLKGL